MYLLKTYRTKLLFAFFINLFFCYPLFYKINYSITMPGGLTKINKVIDIESEYSIKGSINSTFVIGFNRMTMFQYLFYMHEERFEISKVSKSYSYFSSDDHQIMGEVQHNASIEYSIVVAYNSAGKPITYDTIGYILSYIPENFTPLKQGLKLGAIITKVNEIQGEGILDYIKNSDQEDDLDITYLFNTDLNKSYSLKIKRSELNGTNYYQKLGNFKSTPNFVINKSQTIGPSGGLLQTLSNYSALTGFDLTRGEKIAGTGTINLKGEVGAIGGMSQKIYTAQKNKVKIFLVPYSDDKDSYEYNNYQEALETYKKIKKPTFKIIPVKNFTEALEALSDDEYFK